MDKNQQHGIGRREFLITSGGALATLAVSNPLLASVTGVGSRLSVGFAPLGAVAGATDELRPNLISAERLASSDGAFIRNSARVVVLGPADCGRPRGNARTAELLTHFAIRENGDRQLIPYRAWAHSGGCQGSPVSFMMPLDVEQRIDFDVILERTTLFGTGRKGSDAVGQAPEGREIEPVRFSLTLMSGDDGLKLQRGFYVVAPRADGASPVAWESLELRAGNERWSVLGSSLAAAKPVDFDYFVFRIDYANS